MVLKAPEYGDFGFFTEFRITVLARILRKFLKNLYITIFFPVIFDIELECFELKICPFGES